MSERYDVVENGEGARSIWPQARGEPPRGWRKIGQTRDRAGCLDWIESQEPDVVPEVRVRRSERVLGAAAVMPFPRPQATSRLIVFPHAGSGVTYYHFLAKALADTRVQVVLVLYPGRELRMREDPLESMDGLVALLAEELAPFWSDGLPFSFLGHSMGALAAFELTHFLREHGDALPRHLFLSGRQPPHAATNVLRMTGLSDEAFLDAVGHRYGAIPKAILENRDLCALILRSMRADFVLMEGYRMRDRGPLAVPITLLNGRADRWIDEQIVTEWSRYTTAPVASHFFSGDHFYLPGQVQALREAVLRVTGGA